MHKVKAKFVGTNQLEEIRVDFSDVIKWRGKTYKQTDRTWQSPISGTVYGTLLNFRGDYEIWKQDMHEEPYNNPPKHPILYIKPMNTITGHLQSVSLPKGEQVVQVGASLGIVIGQTATRLTKENALDYIEGYTVVNDISIPHQSIYRPNINNKARDRFCPVGPWIIPSKEVSNPDELSIRVSVNGEQIQENTTKNLIRSVSQLLAEVTEFMTLYQGDLLLVGVPEGAPHVRAGDTVNITIDQVGSLENTIIHEI